MHPGFYAWWKHARAHHHGCGEHAHAGPPWARGAHGHGPGHGDGPGHGPGVRFGGFDDDASAGFGIRRPLRFLAHKLDLTEAQVSELAAIMNELKTERAQAAVDHRRRIGALADALEGDTVDTAKVTTIAADSVKTEERVQAAVGKALARIHAMLEPEQRKKLAYLLRTGVLSV